MLGLPPGPRYNSATLEFKMDRLERRSLASINQNRAATAFFLFVVAGHLYQLYDPYFQNLSGWIGIDRLSRENSLGTSGSFLVLIGAAGLYLIKRESRFTYGIIELFFAVATTWFWAINDSGKVDWLGCGAAVYLFVAGFENCFEARKSNKKAESLDIPC